MSITGHAKSLDRCSCNALRRSARQISQLYDAKLAPVGLRASQYSMLVALKVLKRATVNELAHHLDLDRTTTGKNLRPLLRAGLVVVERSAGDGRSREVRLTAEGLARLAEAAPLWWEAQREFEGVNGRTEMAELRARLKALIF